MNTKITKVIDEFDAWRVCHGNVHWNVSRETGNFLRLLVILLDAKIVVEIGTSIGYSGLWFADGLQQTQGKLFTVESHDERFMEATKHFTEADVLDVVTQIKGHAPEVLDDIVEDIDLAFFDATKMEHVSYWEALADKVRVGGVIVTDNILSHAEEFAAYREFVEKDERFEHTVMSIGTGLLISNKLASS